MKDPISATRARTENNEDFYYFHSFDETNVMVIGDFARINYAGVDQLARALLKTIVEANSGAGIDTQILLVQIASEFNNRLLDYLKAFGNPFQCCAVFAVVEGAVLYYLPVGDCRIAVYRNESLTLLNETIWREESGNVLPPVVAADRKVVRGNEDPPDAALGVNPMSFAVTDVSRFVLQAEDTVVLYSDGVDKFVSPVKMAGLISKGEKSEKGRLELAENILDEVDRAHGDDDRSVMLYYGPHLSIDERTKEDLRKIREENAVRLQGISQSNEDKLRVMETNLENKLKSLEGVADGVSNLKGELSHFKESILNSVNAEKIASEIKRQFQEQESAEHQTMTAIHTTLTDVVASLNALNKDVKNLKKTKGLKEEPGPEEAEPAAMIAPPQVMASQSAPVPPAPENAGATNGVFVDPNQLNINREGVIRFWEGRYLLLDENHVRPDLLTEDGSKGKAYFRFEGDTSGLLTGFYLFLRKTNFMLRTDRTVSEISDDVAKEKNQFLTHYSERHFNNARNSHLEIRDKFAGQTVSDRSYKKIVKCELKLAMETPGIREEIDRYADTGKPGHETTKWYANSVYVKWLVIFILTVVVVGTILYLLGWRPFTGSSTGGGTNSNTVKNPADQVPGRLTVGGDGRTIYFNGVKLDTRVQVGKEVEGTSFAEQLGESTLEEHKKQLKLKDHIYILYSSNDDIKEKTDPPVVFWIVGPGDLIPPAVADKDSICKKVLERSKSPTRPNEIKTFNPGLICENLKDGDQILLRKAPEARAPTSTRGGVGTR